MHNHSPKKMPGESALGAIDSLHMDEDYETIKPFKPDIEKIFLDDLSNPYQQLVGPDERRQHL